ncbi:membrane protein [Weissella jogaejeotgali]|uniref:Membrane protein n=2 Tax=Weissella TaxID=46255 RepID=A0A1L6R9M6_9LACO|nr:AI-2E family transporter [Weissella jogaejeotgali]APS41213.1 membrane protein [Weissella jogaejeotgali]CCC56380.1 permease [Weissella thailandensis fsh4-2]
MTDFKKIFKRADVQKLIALIFILAILYIIRDLISIVLLTTIFSYLAVKSARKINRWTKIPYGFSVLIFFTVSIVIFVTAFMYIVPTLVNQFAIIPDEVMKFMKNFPDVKKYLNDTYQNLDLLNEVTKNWRTLLESGWDTLNVIGSVLSKVLLSIFLSFIFAISWQRLRIFGTQFANSNYPKFFTNVYELTSTFVLILGSIIEVQMTIAFINTVLMVIGLSLLKVPSILVMALLIFILGLIPIAGVLISLIPLSVISFAALGWTGMIEVWILIAVIHLFESYFLHPRLMATRTELPIFLTFATIIVMEHLLGAWGLIIGVPIVAFILSILGVQDASISKHSSQVNATETK